MSQEKDILLVGSFGIGYSKNNAKENKDSDFNGAIAYLLTYLTKCGHIVDYVNCIEDEYEMVMDKLSKNKYSLIGISTSFCINIEQVRALVMKIKKLTDVKIVLGGIFTAKLITLINNENSQLLQNMLKRINADYIIYSFQGEKTLSKLISSIINNVPCDKTPNLYYKSNNNIYQYTITEAEENNLEDNWVNWNLIDDESKKGKILPIRTSRSCLFNCSFCTYKNYAGEYRCVSVETIENELNSIGRNGVNDYIRFTDDTFNIPTERFKNILKMMIKNEYNFIWTSFIRCQFINDEIAALMKKSGCYSTSLGIESGNQDMLDLMNKQVKIEDLKRGIDVLKRNGIKTKGLFFIGFPGETRQTVQDTIHFINESGLDMYSILQWTNEQFAPIYEKREIYKLEGIGNIWSHATMNSDEANYLVDEVIKSTIIPGSNYLRSKIIFH